MTQRLDPKARRKDLMAAALAVAERDGYDNMTREAVAKQANVSAALVSHHLGTMPQLRRAVMRAAVADALVAIVARGLVLKDPHALKAPEPLKRRALRTLTLH